MGISAMMGNKTKWCDRPWGRTFEVGMFKTQQEVLCGWDQRMREAGWLNCVGSHTQNLFVWWFEVCGNKLKVDKGLKCKIFPCPLQVFWESITPTPSPYTHIHISMMKAIGGFELGNVVTWWTFFKGPFACFVEDSETNQMPIEWTRESGLDSGGH